ncbi:hypothetical protein JOD57_001161 [Geodermatophilus bullaregiensis]|uniref:serine/threonine protein kinase n=1 Tax=Geodermatophilus bullaregiensis TaxID=1564160 RepID=UPI00195AAD05|nr:serine/threonine protein kinase [Geodermatophilus bullaregiensis]MBM7805324.1 hypothetical protein [Geodermatophilus bullaregiensis]
MRSPSATGWCARPRVARWPGRPADRHEHSGGDGDDRHLRLHRETLLPLQTFGPYELDELLGRGHTGEVHRAWDTRRHRTVALRLLRPELTHDEQFRARFLRECRAAAELDEPHVVAVHDSGEIDGRLYVDTELVDGRDLSAVLAAEGPLPADRAVDVVGQVAAALDAAHARGLVHGDVRPSHVLLSGHSSHPQCHLTGFGTGGAVGGPRYAAPERLTGRPVDHRTDVHALACLLHEALTGAPPSRAAGTAEAGAGRVPPRPSAAAPSVPRELDDVVARGTAEDPDDRHPSAGALALAARAALHPAAPARPATGGARDTVPVAAVPAVSRAGTAAVTRGTPPGTAGTAGRRRHAPPPPWFVRRRGLAAALLAGVLVLAGAGGVVATQLASDASEATPPTPVVVEPADDPAEDPFVPPSAQAPPGTADPTTGDPTSGTDGPTGGTADPTDGMGTTTSAADGPASGAGDPTAGTGGSRPGQGAPAAATGGQVTGDRPGLYGGTGDEVCDPAGMTEYLAEHPEVAEAWADAQDVPADRVGDYLATLTPVVLRFDTAVTNHGLVDGRAVPFQSVLQAGTAVLVDDSGVPQVRCICGNPLDAPASRPAPEYQGDPWPGFSPATVVAVEGSPAPVPAFVLVDDASGVVESRPVGTTGDADLGVDPALAETARLFRTAGAPSSSDSSTSSSGGSAGTGPTSAGGGSPPEGTGEEPEGATQPDPGPGTGGFPDGDPPSPGDAEQPDAPAPDGGTDGDGPAYEPPAEQPPDDEAPAGETGTETPTDEVPAEEVPAEETPAEETPAEETPAEETPAEETPTEQTPTEDTPTETATDEAPAYQAPAGETPAGETPTDGAPTEATSSAEASTAEAPTTEAPSTGTPTAGTATEEPTVP